MELKNFLRVIRLRWLTIAAATLAGLLLAWGYTYLQTPLYEAKSQLFISVKAGASASDVYQTNEFAEKRVTSYVSLATSARVLDAVAQELQLGGGAQALVGKVTAATPPQTVLIDITATDSDPRQAARIANSTTKQLIAAVDATGDLSFVDLSVFEEAATPSSPSSPRPRLNLAIGMLFGLLVGFGLAFLREVLDTRVRSQQDVERTVKAGILGTIAFDASLEKEPVSVQRDALSPRAESYRQIRGRLRLTNIAGGAQTIVVSSSIPGEGKTSVAVNLSITLAESGCRVLLVDADPRNSRVAKVFGIDGSVGLSDVLLQTVALEEAIQKWDHDGALHILTSGLPASNLSGLMGSSSMEQFIARVETSYEVVVIDAPPLVPVPDAAILGAKASGVVLVVSADGRTSQADLAQALANLEAANAKLLGVVVNRVRKAPRGQSYENYRPESEDAAATAREG